MKYIGNINQIYDGFYQEKYTIHGNGENMRNKVAWNTITHENNGILWSAPWFHSNKFSVKLEMWTNISFPEYEQRFTEGSIFRTMKSIKSIQTKRNSFIMK